MFPLGEDIQFTSHLFSLEKIAFSVKPIDDDQTFITVEFEDQYLGYAFDSENRCYQISIVYEDSDLFFEAIEHFKVDYHKPIFEIWELGQRKVSVKVSLLPKEKGLNQINFNLSD